MKLSDYEGEQALDVLADLIEPAMEIMADKEMADREKSSEFGWRKAAWLCSLWLARGTGRPA